MIIACLVCHKPIVQSLYKRRRRIHAGHCENVRYARIKKARRKAAKKLLQNTKRNMFEAKRVAPRGDWGPLMGEVDNRIELEFLKGGQKWR